MQKTKRSLALGALTAEMASPRIAASAQEAMHPATEETQRRLILINEPPFYGYACSWCGCRFSREDVRNGGPVAEIIRGREQREKHFAEHVCSERPH
jgi:hypothetical protein